MTIAEKILRAKSDYDAVYEAGKNAGGGGGQGSYDEGYEAGQKAEYDAFWDGYQSNGHQTMLDYFFAGKGWVKATIKPKIDLKPTRANSMFSMNGFKGDLAQHFETLGKELDFSNCTMINGLFSNANEITRLGTLDFRKVTYGTGWFAYMRKLITIDKLLLSENTISPGNHALQECYELTNLTIEGVINKNGYSFQWSTKLSKVSIESIMAALSTTTSGLTVTLSKTAVNNAFTKDEWEALVSQHTNWTISLI